MQQADIDLVRASFAKVLHIRSEAGRLFYDRLFTIAPQVRPLFKTDIDEQARKLMDTLAIAVGALRDPAALTATLEDLGRRHRRYGAQPGHYAKVGEALLWTLEKGLGSSFDAKTRAAWVKLYDTVSEMMEPRAAKV